MKAVCDSLKDRKVDVSYIAKIYDRTPCIGRLETDLVNGQRISAICYFFKDGQNNYYTLLQSTAIS